MTNFHLVHKGGWILIPEGQMEVVQSYKGETKQQAIELASEYLNVLGDSVSLKIHNEDGTISEERTYPREADPQKSEG